jgi:NAD+ synthetase
MNELNYERVFNVLVNETSSYIVKNHLKAMILGISGGIDSTVVAAICHEVSKQTGIPLIGRSLPIKNRNDEFEVSKLVGEAFCNDFAVCPMTRLYHAALKEVYQVENMERHESTYTIEELEQANGQTKIANGNIQARLRMMFLYNLASIHKGLVMSTDNQTEYQLGFWTIHGDVGDFDPIQDLWKTEVYGLANYLLGMYYNLYCEATLDKCKEAREWEQWWKGKYEAMKASIALTPTDGLGISNSDLDQIGAKSYNDVDRVLQTLVCPASPENDRVQDALAVEIGPETIDKIIKRHRNSGFKREKSPIYISRELYK